MDILKVPSQITRVQTMSDGGLRLFVDTQELTTGDKALVMGLHRKTGWFAFSEGDIKPEDFIDLPEIKEKDQKSQSQRLRSVLFVIWQKRGSKGSFEDFYREYLEKVIDKLKEELD